MSQITGAPMLGDPMPADVEAATKGVRGIDVFVCGGSTGWHRPIYPGGRLCSCNEEETPEVKESEFPGRSVIQVRRDVKLNQRGES